MKQIEINPSNKPYYSKEFVMGFECGTKEQYDADKGVIRKIKQAREEVNNMGGDIETIADCLQILDKLIAEEERGGADGN